MNAVATRRDVVLPARPDIEHDEPIVIEVCATTARCGCRTEFRIPYMLWPGDRISVECRDHDGKQAVELVEVPV